jgi:integrase
MARKIRHSRLESRTARLKLPIRKKPHSGVSLAPGVSLLYRRNKGNGSWVDRVLAGDGRSYWTKAFAAADDYAEADGDKILNFFQAQDRAKELARGHDSKTASAAAPITVEGALDAYESDLGARGANAYNAQWPKAHLTAGLLAKPVMLLTTSELKHWRNSLLAMLAPASVNRLCNALCAALELAAQHDKRITNRDAWEVGLAGLPDAQVARNVILTDAEVHAFVHAAYDRDAQLGLLVEVLAISGARPSQAVRLLVEDLRDHPTRPKLAMPRSGKGGGRNRSARKAQRFLVPITKGLAAKLRAAAQGRAPDAPLLTQSNGWSWHTGSRVWPYRHDVRAIVISIGLDPDVVTIYALRHSSIARALLRNVAIRLVASLHDTSVGQIERNYSRHITQHEDADMHARAGLLEDPAAPLAAGNVISRWGR